MEARSSCPVRISYSHAGQRIDLSFGPNRQQLNRVAIFDAHGREIFSESPMHSGDAVDMSRHAGGVYYIRANDVVKKISSY
jgi:hypothetical protein